ncbi:MAG: hypothetical protein KIS74_11880 [Burkholderiales bacterium]|nr:hypothetical protein [Burkholderiales bacterium]
MRRLAAAALAAWAGCAPAQPAAVAECAKLGKEGRECLLRAMRAHPAKSAAFWEAVQSRPIDERLGPAPAELVDYLHLDNAANGFPEKPRASRPSAEFMADMRGAIADLPSAVRRAFDATFAGVWLVDDLGGTGYTDTYVDAKNRPVGGFIVLDAAVLGKFTANAWATWKENTPFKPGGGWTLEARIEDSAGDNRRSAIRYILLHELGHVLAINRDVHPRWDLQPSEVPESARFPFYDLSWTVNRRENRYASKYDDAFRERRWVVYYRAPKHFSRDMVPIYDALKATNFPALYAATSPGDDFAESFVTYVHTVLMKRPWEITIRKDGKVAKTYRTCWDEPRCAAKRRILEDLLR